MDTQILQDIGLTKNEINVYLALLELGKSSAGKVLEKSNLQILFFCIVPEKSLPQPLNNATGRLRS